MVAGTSLSRSLDISNNYGSGSGQYTSIRSEKAAQVTQKNFFVKEEKKDVRKIDPALGYIFDELDNRPLSTIIKDDVLVPMAQFCRSLLSDARVAA